MSGALTILVVGGYGTFGGRMVELLEHHEGLTFIIAGRSLDKAKAWCAARTGAKAKLVPAQFDRGADPSPFKPDIVVDASGPFQDYGSDAYKLVEACIRGGINYIDLADSSDFVMGISAHDAAAKAAGVFVLSGVSSFPVLTAAVVRQLSADMPKVESIKGGIAPSPFANVGMNVIRVIAGYAGQDIDAGGRRARPLTEIMRYTIAVPGRVPVGNRLFSLVDVPDLRILRKIWPDAHVWMGAGPVPEPLHWSLVGFAWLVRLGLVKSLARLAPLMYWAVCRLSWGEHRGGMFVEVSGGGVTKSWHLLAEGADGPLIPSMPAASLVARRLAGEKFAAGARAALDDITLEDYHAQFSPRTIYTGTHNDTAEEALPLHRRILGDAWDRLPQALRDMHGVEGLTTAEGTGSVARGSGLLAKLACLLMRFPPAGENLPISVRFDVKGATEKWTRSFGDSRFSSRIYPGTGRSARLMIERFGPLAFALALVEENGRLLLVLRRWSILGLPLPLWLGPRAVGSEFVQDGRFNFDVKISHPLTGLIVHYRGWLQRKA
ncbi:MAG: DUF4166 domain-containing protein [Alphaproteobacteria bacterium]